MNYQIATRLLALLMCALPVSAAYAGGIIANPMQLEMSAKQRGSSVKIHNVSDEDKLLRISFQEQQMLPDGTLVAGEPGRWAASPLLRFSPRQILVPAGSSQTVRLLYRRRVGMPDGEYRSHLAFQEIPRQNSQSTVDDGGVKLNKVNGFAIPVYVHQGDINASIKPASARWEPGPQPMLSLALAREGNASAYGRFEVVSGTPQQPRATLFSSRKFGVYKELQQRVMKVQLPTGITANTPMFARVWTLNQEAAGPATLAVSR